MESFSNLRIYSEDSFLNYDSIVGIKCNRRPQQNAPNAFSYEKYAEEISSRIQKTKAELSDEYLKQELFSFYGEMDEGDEKFAQIFQNYKEERLEALGGDEAPEQLEPKKFLWENSRGQLITIDPFLLRRKPKVIPKDKSNYSRKESELCSIISQIIDRHPRGICSSLLLQELNKSCPHNKYYELPPITNKICSIVSISPEKSLCFHPQLKGLVSQCLLENIWHKLRVVTSLKLGIVRLSSLFPLCSQIFGWESTDFWKPWGWRSEGEFVQALMALWGDLDAKLVIRGTTGYLTIVANEGQSRLVEGQVQTKKKTEKNRQPMRNETESAFPSLDFSKKNPKPKYVPMTTTNTNASTGWNKLFK